MAKDKNKSFNVAGSVGISVGFYLQVEAASKEEAEQKVREMLTTKREYSIHDFDGNRIDFDKSDIDIDAVE
jgi:hypothetical protein